MKKQKNKMSIKDTIPAIISEIIQTLEQNKNNLTKSLYGYLYGQSDRMIQTIMNGKITTTAILTIQNHQVPWK